MTLFAALDATRVADRLVDDSDDARWARPIATAVRASSAPAKAPAKVWSVWSLARNPHALLLTGMLGAVMVHDAVRGRVDPGLLLR